MAAAADARTCPTPEPDLSSISTIPYPTASQRAGETGATMLTVTVAPDGKPTGAAVTRSSGVERLDDTASSYIVSHYRWKKSDDACPAFQQPMTVIWQLGNPPKADGAVQVPAANYPASALQLEEQGDTYVALSLGDGGAVQDVRIAYGSGYAELDEQSIAIVKAAPNLMAGKPAGKYTLILRWTAPPHPNWTRLVTTSRAQRLP
jgi:TonB family protein